MQEHPIAVLINSLFSGKPQEKRDKWTGYLIDQEFDTIEDLRKVSEQGWANMGSHIPLSISANIRQKIHLSNPQKSAESSKKAQKIIEEKSNPQKNNDNLSPSFQTLLNIVGNDSQFMKVRVDIQSMNQLEEIQRVLQEYMILKKAKQLAANLFKELKKDTTVLSPIDIFQTCLRKFGLSSQDVCDLRYLIDKGKKLAVRNKLFELLGSVNGQTQYKEVEKFIAEKGSKPIEGSKFIKEKNGLNQFQYNERLLQSEKASAKTLIVFGQTGCGKSTFLNAIVNYIAGVQMEDTFRYIVIVENDSSQLKSITSTINDYYIKNSRTGQVYRLIDTPGFGDTEGIQKDNQLVKMISVKFKQDIECIHSVLFVMKASTTRVTSYQQYVFQSVMDLFDKQIAPNFVFIFTFSDSGKPQVLPSVMDKKYGFGVYWDQIIEPKYIEVNNCGFFEKIDEKDNMKTYYWKIGIECLDRLFGKVNSIQAKSLMQSKQMIRTKETLNIQIANTTEIIRQAISKRQNIKRHIEAIVYHKEEINNNKNFRYKVPEDQWYPETTSSNVTRCNTASCFAEKNCHINCSFGNGEDKMNCAVMNSSGYCTVCSCHYSAHTNSNIIRKVRQVMKTKINSENKRKYDLSNKQMKTSEAALKDMFNQLDIQMKKVIDATNQMAILQEQLVKVQMSSRKPQSTKAYLQYLIQNENRMQDTNYQSRVQGLNEAIKQLQLHENIIKGHGKNDVKKIMNEIRDANAENIMNSVEPGFFQKIKNFIFD